jgi:hypothetical protein
VLLHEEQIARRKEPKEREMSRWIFALTLAALGTGCTSTALERRTRFLGESAADLRYKEVIDNLAMIAANHWALPAYSSIYAGSARISDTVSVIPSGAIAREAIKQGGTFTTLDSKMIEVQAQRMVTDNWTLDPVAAPETLAAMRAACWWVLDGPECLSPEGMAILSKNSEQPKPCDECGAPIKPPKQPPSFPPPELPPGHYFGVAEDLAKIPPGWVHIGKCRDVPRRACYKSHCHNTYVWVDAEGLAGLSAFTLVLQKLARTDVNSVYYPKATTLAITKQWGGKLFSDYTKVSIYVDRQGRVVSGPGQFATPVKLRENNIGTDQTLRSLIAVTQSR